MKKSVLMIAITCLIAFIANTASAQVKRDSLKKDTALSAAAASDINGAISANAQLSTLGKVIRVAKMSSVFAAAGPYTVFAPTNLAFGKLGQKNLDSLVKDSTQLHAFLKYHIVVGRYTKDDIIKALSSESGKLVLNTLNGETLQLTVNADKNLEITDAKGNKAYVTAFDQTAGNGVVHSIDRPLMP